MATKFSFQYSPAELKKFRHGIAILKKKGIITNIDARTAQPGNIRQGKKLADQVKKFDDVISGKAEAIKLPQSKLRAYKKAGYETQQGRIIIPKLRNDKVSVVDGEIKITDKKSGISHIKKAVPYHNLEQWLTDMQKNHLRINAMKRRNEWFAYKIDDNKSWNAYRTIEKLLDDVKNGSTSGLNLSDKIRHESHKQQNEFFGELEIVRIPRAEPWINRSHERKRGKPATAKQRRLWYHRIKNTAKGEAMRRKNAERQQKYRNKLKGEKLKEYMKDGAKRARKSRKKSGK